MLRHNVLVVGKSNAGKSNFCMQLAENVFSSNYLSTLFVETYQVRVSPTQTLVLYDTPGQLRFHQGLEPKYAQCDIAVLVVRDNAIDDELVQRIQQWAPLISWIVVANVDSAFDCTTLSHWAAQAQLPFYRLNVQTKEGLPAILQELLRLASFHASRLSPVSLQMADVQYLHYCM